MEDICCALSELLCASGLGGYKIYYEDELTDVLPDELRSRETLEAALKFLTGGGYVDVKYARGEAFCIAALKKFTPPPPVEEPSADEAAAEPCGADCADETVCLGTKLYIVTAVCSFLGGAAGGCIAALLGALL